LLFDASGIFSLLFKELLFVRTEPFCNFSDKDMAVLTLMRVGGIAKSALIEYGASSNNNSLNNNEKIPDASKSKSINGKLTSPCVPQKKKEEKTLVVFFRDRKEVQFI
jgi:hypothetical protein